MQVLLLLELFKGKTVVLNCVMSMVKIGSVTVLYLFLFCYDSPEL